MPRLIKTCSFESCSKRPSYGYEGSKATHCSKHSLPGMIDRNNPLCSEYGCGKHACFGFENHKRTRCKKHSIAGMIDLKNLKKQRCIEVNCSKYPSFGYNQGKPLYCASHSLQGMINLNKPSCLTEGCQRRATFGVDSFVACRKHSLPGMFYLRSKHRVQGPELPTRTKTGLDLLSMVAEM